VGKTTIAGALAKEFGLQMYNGGDILKLMAAERGYPDARTRDDWWDTEEAKKFMLEREGDPSFDTNVDKRLKELVRQGGAVITSYTIPWLVGNSASAGQGDGPSSPSVIKFWLKGSALNRARRMANRDGIELSDASAIVSLRDRENKKIYKHLYGFDFGENLEVFDYMLNTDVLRLEKLIEVSKVIVAGHKAGLA